MLLLLACIEPHDDGSLSGDDTGGATTDPLAYLHGTAELVEPAEECPEMDGKIDMTSGGLARSAKVILPPDGGEGKPVLFAWYPLGGSVSWMVNALDLEEYAELHDTIVVVPEASGKQTFEWYFLSEPTDNPDLTFYDELRTCLYREHAVDLGRVSSMGFSAGALWTSYLSLYRGDTLATILTFSGGTDPIFEYSTPASEFPALLIYGGTSDVYGGMVHFDEATESFANELYADEHFVSWCNHDLGHTIPSEGRDMMDAWLPAHTYGEPSPFADGDLSAFPDWCEVFAP